MDVKFPCDTFVDDWVYVVLCFHLLKMPVVVFMFTLGAVRHVVLLTKRVYHKQLGRSRRTEKIGRVPKKRLQRDRR
jgi:heme/copper-type cytochrome/quinol oxidase subunit 1